MFIIILGGGGREAAMAWKLSHSNSVEQVWVSPGNAGMRAMSPKILTQTLSREEIVAARPDLVVIGPEQFLSEGMSDFLRAHQIPVVGPSQAASRLETSKIFCKEIFSAARVPTAKYKVAHSITEVTLVLETWQQTSVVVKADGLAQGKGVVVCENKSVAFEVAQAFFDGSYLGEPVEALVLEEVLIGEECSVFALCDGKNFVSLGSAVDHKRLLDGDQGPNTGGMGAISPAPFMSAEDMSWVENKVFAPVLKVMRDRGTPFSGFLFAGLMKTESGYKVLELNVRMGDPETQAVLPRMKEDFMPWLVKAANAGIGAGQSLQFSSQISCHVVMAAHGYPGVAGKIIRKGDSLSCALLQNGAQLFTAAVSGSSDDLKTSGGRVCGVTALGESLGKAREKVYQEIKKISFAGAQFRHDIGAKYL